jgi:hypothetical protein
MLDHVQQQRSEPNREREATGRMDWVFVEGYAIIVHDDKTPSASDWQRWLEACLETRDQLHGLLVYSQGGGPDAGQRSQLLEIIKDGRVKYPTAILTPSTLMRAMITALNWFLPSAARAEVFAPTQLERAFDHLRVPEATRAALRSGLGRALAKPSS